MRICVFVNLEIKKNCELLTLWLQLHKYTDESESVSKIRLNLDNKLRVSRISELKCIISRTIESKLDGQFFWEKREIVIYRERVTWGSPGVTRDISQSEASIVRSDQSEASIVESDQSEATYK